MKLSAWDSQINYLAYALKCKGIRKEDRVAFVAHTTQEIICLFFALWRLQAIACPLSPRLPNLSPYLEALQPHFFLREDQLSFSRAPTLSYQLDDNQIATLLFTSGSSAFPKIASHTLGNHLYSARGVNQALAFSENHSWQLSLPLYHVSGIAILFRVWIANAALLLPHEPIEKATHLSMVPTQVLRLQKRIDSTILIGGGPIPSSLYTQGLRLKTSYGLTEMSSTVTIDGELLTDRELTIDDTQEILVKGKTLFQGYLHQEPQTGWFKTGDLGRYTEKGIEIIGRKDNLFISGGENIQPEEIEKELLKLPGVEQAVVVPQEEKTFGKRPVAFIYSPTKSYSLCEIHALLEKILPRFKLPVELLPFPKQIDLAKPSRPDLLKLANCALNLKSI